MTPTTSRDRTAPDSPEQIRAAGRWLSSLAREVKGRFYLTILTAGLGAAATICQCWLLARLIDGAAIRGETLSVLQPYLWLLGLAMLLRAGLDALRQAFGFETAANIRQGLRTLLLERIAILGPAWASTQRSGAVAATLSEGVEAIESYFSAYLPQRMIAGLVPLAILVVLYPFDWVSGTILLVTAPIIPLFMIIVGKGAEALNRRQWRRLALMSAHFFDVVAGLTTLRQSGAARRQASIVGAISQDYRQVTMQVLRLAFLSSLVLEFFATIATAMVAVYVGFRLFYGTMAFLPGLFALLLAPEFFRPLRDMGAHYHARMEALGATESLLAILHAPLPVAGASLPLMNRAPREIRFENVCFNHSDGPGLADLSFTLRQGQTLALVGASGAGKTTVVRLLLGLLRPDTGRILIDGQDLSAINLSAWQSLIGWLPQRPTIFSGTIESNICLGIPDASEEDIRLAAQRANASSFIEALPDGYQHAVGDGGRGLSGGQIRRVALARALLAKPSVLILDEPTAALDEVNAERTISSVINAFPEALRLIVTHDLKLAAEADAVIVLADGKVLRAGPPAVLETEDVNASQYEELMAGSARDA
ncbi:thiol reductant ABC exporter subunit CydD [Neorhizobium sp. NCHU2750]|uniref:thiol reductant ABC exporter subunit CydD n=1 Tax=Neorhizobium sp. NCHU2750 TaxID=1825976 RepID=UPI000E747B45|nr:ABC transporter permease [Neorhizobium sp. NCHU2750]